MPENVTNTTLDNNALVALDKPKGKSGNAWSSGILNEDHLKDLIGVEQYDIFNKMLRSDTQVGKVEFAITNPILSANWSFEAASTEQSDIDAALLMEQILFKDLVNGWKAKLGEILTAPFMGFSCFEVITKNTVHPELGPYTGLKNLGFRDHRSLTEWKHDTNTEELLEVLQVQSGDLEVDAWLDATNLLIFWNRKKGTDLGTAILRRLYGPYKRKLLAKQLQMIGVERSAIPVPKMIVPKAAKPESDEYKAAEEQLAAYTNAETAYFLIPEGYELEFDSTNTFDPSKIQHIIKSENEDMAGSILASFLEMGIGGNSGNQASGTVLVDFYTKGLTYIADNIADTINNRLVPMFMALNYGDSIKKFPMLIHSGITEEAGKELMEIVTGYTKAGVIQADELLEDHIRKIHSLPKKEEGSIEDNGGTQDDNTNGPDTNSNDSVSNKNNFEDMVELSDKGSSVRGLIIEKANEINNVIKNSTEKMSIKFIHDTLVKYKTLGTNQKQKSTSTVVMSGKKKLQKDIRLILSNTAIEALNQAKKEVPLEKAIKLSSKPQDFSRVSYLTNNYSTIDLADSEQLPAHIRVLIAKQSELMAASITDELGNILKFQFSSSEVNTTDTKVINKEMSGAATKYSSSGARAAKGSNAASLVTNESRNSWFFESDVNEQIESYTFENVDPKTEICTQLTGKTFAANDIDSLRFSPPLHHNCKSYLSANIKGDNNPEITSLSPTAKAKEGITL